MFFCNFLSRSKPKKELVYFFLFLFLKKNELPFEWWSICLRGGETPPALTWPKQVALSVQWQLILRQIFQFFVVSRVIEVWQFWLKRGYVSNVTKYCKNTKQNGEVFEDNPARLIIRLFFGFFWFCILYSVFVNGVLHWTKYLWWELSVCCCRGARGRDGQFRFNQDWGGGKKGSVGHYHFGPLQVPVSKKWDR